MKNIKDNTQKEILNQIKSPCHGLLELAPRVGKTKICIDLLKREKVKKVLWVTPSVKLRDVDIPNEFILWKAKSISVDIICYSSLENHKGKYEVIILDEFQDITVANSSSLLNGNIKYERIIGLSGTPPRNQIKLDLLRKLKLKTIIKMGIEEAINKDLIADYHITVVNCETNKIDKNIQGGRKDKPFFQTEKKAYDWVTSNIYRPFFTIKRLRLIYDSKTKEDTASNLLKILTGRKLVFCSTIAQSIRLGGENVFNSKSGEEKLKKFLNNEIDELYCVNSGGVGFTYKNIDHLVIIQASSDNKGDTTQKLARALLQQGSEYKGKIWIICLEDTQDKVWVESFLKNFNKEKISFKTLKNLEK